MDITGLDQGVFELPERERAILGERLLTPLGEKAVAFNEPLWFEEAEQRYAELRAARNAANPQRPKLEPLRRSG